MLTALNLLALLPPAASSAASPFELFDHHHRAAWQIFSCFHAARTELMFQCSKAPDAGV